MFVHTPRVHEIGHVACFATRPRDTLVAQLWASVAASSRRTRLMRLRHAVVIAFLVTGVLLRAWIIGHLNRDLAVCSVDFGSFYAGGKLAGSLAMYSPAAVFAEEDRAMGCHTQNLIFIKPPFYGLLMRPLTRLPFQTALWLWRMLGLCALGVFLWLWPGDRLVAMAACAWFLPEATNFTMGQDVAIVLALTTGGYYCLKTGRPIAGGVLMGLGAIKFHLFLLLPLVLLRRKMWRAIAAAATTVALLMGIAFAVYGPGWLRTYRLALRDWRLNPYFQNMVNLNGLFHGRPIWIVAALAVVLLTRFINRRASLDLALAAALAGGVLVVPHNTISDGLLFLPLILEARRFPGASARAIATVAFIPILPPGWLQIAVILLLMSAVRTLRLQPAAPGRQPAVAAANSA